MKRFRLSICSLPTSIARIILILAGLAMMTSCDPACTEELVVKNQSGHEVVVTRYHTVYAGLWNNRQPIEDSVRTDVATIRNGDETKSIEGHLGVTDRKSIELTMEYLYWQDSVRFEFDDGTTRTFRLGRDTAWGPYAFGSDNYSYEEKRNPGLTFHNAVLWSRLTYTITEEDHNRCKEE
ncbi:MAG: hypothetical protein MJZ81_07960 [Bacteroidales bacterium]|nr:hypothetical protein [Bacteroidales bacterium]